MNWDADGEETGYKSPKVAKTRYNQIMSKIASQMSGSPSKPQVDKDKLKDAIGSGTNASASKVKKSVAGKGGKKKMNNVGKMTDAFVEALSAEMPKVELKHEVTSSVSGGGVDGIGDGL